MNVVLCELPPVEQVEVLRLGRVRVHGMSIPQDVSRMESDCCVRVEGEAAQTIAALWRQLPPGREERCHIPAFALRFLAGDEVVLEASLCWRCNNIWIIERGARKYASFDANAPVSKQLLQLLEEAVSV